MEVEYQDSDIILILGRNSNSRNVEQFKRQLDSHFQSDNQIHQLKKLLQLLYKNNQAISDEDFLDVGQFIIQQTISKNQIEEEIYNIKMILFEIYQGQQNEDTALKLITSIKYKDQKFLNKEQVFEKFLQIAVLYLNQNDAGNAGPFIDECGAKLDDANELQKIQYKGVFARYQDFNLKFQMASQSFISMIKLLTDYFKEKNQEIDQSEMQSIYISATICAMLSPAGDQRSRILTHLYKDEQLRALKIYTLLEKMHMERIIKKNDLIIINQYLLPHHTRITYFDDDLSVLDKALIEHNIQAIRKIYETISFESVSRILQIKPQTVERILQKMICEKRIKAILDQESGFIHFIDEKSKIEIWNDQIENFSQKLEQIVKIIQHK